MKSFPWDSIAASIGEDGYPVYDRSYMASDLREVYQTFFSNGIFTDSADALKVSPGENMTVRVAPGRCCINGTIGYENEERVLALPASTSQDQICTVVLRWDASIDAREIDLYVLAGAPSDTPTRPTLTRSDTVWELGLCDIYVTAYSLSPKAEKMTDTRLDQNRCGVVAPFVQLNTKNFYDQLQAQTRIAVELAQSAIDDTIAGQLQTAIEGKVSKAGDTMTGELVLEEALGVESGGTGVESIHGNPGLLHSLFGKVLTGDIEFVPVFTYGWDEGCYMPKTNFRKQLMYIAPPVTTPSYDTTVNWGSVGNVVSAYGKTGMLNGQPSQFGILANFTNNISEVHQQWMGQSDGNIWHRGGNADGFRSWKKLLDDKNTAGYIEIGQKYVELAGGYLALSASKVVSATSAAFPVKPDFVVWQTISGYRASHYGTRTTINSNNTVTVSTTLYNLSNEAGDTNLRGYVVGYRAVGNQVA